MRIGVMLRDIGDQTDAPGIIVLNLMDELLKLDRYNEYILFYRNASFIDRYTQYSNVKARLVKSKSKILWDQWAIPHAVRREKIDLLFHPKHSIPLLVKCKTIMHLRGPEYWINPQYYEWYDLLYQKIALQLFSRKANHLIAESEYAKSEFQKYLKIPDNKISVCYLAASPRFRLVDNKVILNSIREKYRLPEKYVLTVTRVLQGNKQYDGKNIKRMLQAFEEAEIDSNIHFVIVGRQTKSFVEGYVKNKSFLDRLHVLDFVKQQDLPSIYNQAELFLFPSINESFGIPIVEAMHCGCPVITSNDTACQEISGNASFLVNPSSVNDIKFALERLLHNEQLRNTYRKKGLKRSIAFDWSLSAKKTLQTINSLV